MRSTFFLLLTILSLTSCEKFFNQNVEVDPPEYTPQLVFHLRMTDNDQAVRLVLTRNFGSLENVNDYSRYYVKGATAEWWENGQKVLTLSPLSPDSAFVYTADLPAPLQAGKTYEVRVQHPDFEEVQARQVMPGDFTINDMKARLTGQNEFGDLRLELNADLLDQAGANNFYEIRVRQLGYQIDYVYDPVTGQITFDTLGLFYQSVYFEDFPDPNVVRGIGNAALVSDQFFNGETYRLKLPFTPSYYSSIDSVFQFQVVVRNVTEDNYRWSRTYYQQYNSDFNLFAEPFTVFSNIENGLGIFGLGREQTFEVTSE